MKVTIFPWEAFDQEISNFFRFLFSKENEAMLDKDFRLKVKPERLSVIKSLFFSKAVVNFSTSF